MDINKLSSKFIGAAIEVHKTLRPSLLESTYSQGTTLDVSQIVSSSVRIYPEFQCVPDAGWHSKICTDIII